MKHIEVARVSTVVDIEVAVPELAPQSVGVTVSDLIFFVGGGEISIRTECQRRDPRHEVVLLPSLGGVGQSASADWRFGKARGRQSVGSLGSRVCPCRACIGRRWRPKNCSRGRAPQPIASVVCTIIDSCRASDAAAWLNQDHWFESRPLRVQNSSPRTGLKARSRGSVRPRFSRQ